jgi:hypothetical protein
MLAEAPGRGFLGRVTLLQVTVLSALLGYLLIFSYVEREQAHSVSELIQEQSRGCHLQDLDHAHQGPS